MSSRSKLMRFINYKLRVTISRTRTLVGQFLAFDRHMNLVLADCEEYRKLKPKKETNNQETEVKRRLGLVVLRGDCVISLTAEAPPPPKPRAPSVGPGVAKAGGRGAPIAPVAKGLTGTVRGVGGAGGAAMMPVAAAGAALIPSMPMMNVGRSMPMPGAPGMLPPMPSLPMMPGGLMPQAGGRGGMPMMGVNPGVGLGMGGMPSMPTGMPTMPGMPGMGGMGGMGGGVAPPPGMMPPPPPPQ